MPNPVSAPNSSYYDPHAQLTPADGADSAAATCEVTPSREVNLPPVTITGDAGAKQLVQRHDVARQQATCTVEGATAALSCGKAGLVAAAGVLVSATTVVGTALAAASALAEGISCGRDLRAYYDCKTQ
jgi:hypothetical protein